MTTELDLVDTTTTTTTDILTLNEDEDPCLSSASLCIQFNILGETFRPVFTHQAFPGEIIRGYHPPLATLMEFAAQATKKTNNDNTATTNRNGILHSSHSHHERASKELSIKVTLAPSCETCQVIFATEKKRLPRAQSVRASKRPRLCNTNDVTKSTSATAAIDEGNQPGRKHIVGTESSRQSTKKKDSEEDDDSFQEDPDATSNDNNSEPEYSEKDMVDEDSEFEVEDDEGVSEVEEEDARRKEGATRTSRMPTKDILKSLAIGLPEVVTDDSANSVEDKYLRRPLGVELQEYSVKGKDFVLSLATGAESSSFHAQVQRMALWFIETGDDVDVASQDGGFWNVLYLFQKHKRTQYSLAGYITLFHFHAPFKKPQPGYVVRICQALVLPPFQRMGHGKKLLNCVIDIAHGKYTKVLPKNNKSNEIVEINVESPAPAFVMLRNRTDYDCFVQSLGTDEDPWVESLVVGGDELNNADFFTSISESNITLAAAKAKVIPRQVQIVQELYKLCQLQDYVTNSKVDDDEQESLEKRFRLMVKKRLNKEHREDLSGLRTKAEKQAFLETAYTECLESYRATLPKTK